MNRAESRESEFRESNKISICPVCNQDVGDISIDNENGEAIHYGCQLDENAIYVEMINLGWWKFKEKKEKQNLLDDINNGVRI